MQINNHTIDTFDAKGLKIAIITSSFNKEIIEQLLKQSKETLLACNLNIDDLTIIKVPGAAEIPCALDHLASTNKYDCLVALGCIIRGETPHFEYVSNMAQQGILQVSLSYHIPIGFGVLMTNTLEQAQARYHVAAESIVAALKLAMIKKQN